jgi:hypothetical protein
VNRITENVKDYPLNSEESAAIDSILEGFVVSGARYGGPQAALIEG